MSQCLAFLESSSKRLEVWPLPKSLHRVTRVMAQGSSSCITCMLKAWVPFPNKGWGGKKTVNLIMRSYYNKVRYFNLNTLVT